MATADQIIEALSNIVGDGKVKTDQSTLTSHGCDWTKLYNPEPLAIVFPKNTEEVQAITLLANKEEFGLVPSGGRTGLSGGAVAAKGEVVEIR